jgi:hypothetical protein
MNRAKSSERGNKMKIKEIDDEILFDNGHRIYYHHDQDCCENVYADFKVLNDYNLSTKTGKTINIKDIDFPDDIDKNIEYIEEMGFNIISKIGEKFFIPCYNSQNGYYGSDLELIILKGKEKIEINISAYVKDDID